MEGGICRVGGGLVTDSSQCSGGNRPGPDNGREERGYFLERDARGEPRGASPRRQNPHRRLEDLNLEGMRAPARSGNVEYDPSMETPHGVPRGASLQWRP